jgi:putative membrane-bound dehydrogenase-like protein
MRRSFSAFLLAFSAPVALAQLPPEKALATMKAGEGLQVELFAAEPMLLNPTAIDVDHKGRVWVCEGVNYRCKLRNRPLYRKEGDRLQILIDEKGDGQATKSVTFYQGLELMSPLGVCVLPQADGKGLRVLAAQSPDILEFWDRDGDLKADGPPTKFLTGFGGIDHDHGVHGLSVGPDGKLYFTVGDQGVKGLQSKDGKGKSWTTNKTDCQAGTVWRCDLDGTNLELIAHNFRNNYECAVDSFGEIWLSDNDDDGNQQTRICHVLPGGNYGYWPRGPGQSHWHEEQPGIVHKTLRTGFGSPTGICFYEGNLLPKQYQGDLIHCDAGPREVRYFKRTPKGAGYELERKVMLDSTDTWFRPSAARVAPDGSVFVADWYDPGVGGHGMGDTTRGRIYRLTPGGHKGYRIRESNLSILDQLYSPNNTLRYFAFQNAKEMTENEWKKYVDENQKQIKEIIKQARFVWLGAFKNYLDLFVGGESSDKSTLSGQRMNMLIARLELVNRQNIDFMEQELSNLKKIDVEVTNIENIQMSAAREYVQLYAKIQNVGNENLKRLFYAFIAKYDGQDRTYLAALNIACGTDPARRDAILADFEKHFPEWNDKVADLVWELRPKSMLPKMGKLLDDPKLTAKQKARIVDIIAVNDDVAAGKTVIGLLSGDRPAEVKQRAVENLRLFLPTKWKDLAKDEELKSMTKRLLAGDDYAVGLQLAAINRDESLVGPAFDCVKDKPERIPAVAKALAAFGSPAAVEKLKILLMGAGYAKADLAPVLDALGSVVAVKGHNPGGKEAQEILHSMVKPYDEAEGAAAARAAISALAASRVGTQWLLRQHEEKKLPAMFVTHAGTVLRNSPFQGERNKALQLFPVVAKLDLAKLPALEELAKKPGDAKRGEAIYMASFTGEAQCMKCHKVNGKGGEIGPDLSAIGTKGSVQNLFESILYPSRAIADQHVSWAVSTADGQTVTGLLVKETETALTIRDANGKDTVIETKNVEAKKKSLVSLMPEDVVKSLTEPELVDLVAYLATLKAVVPEVKK